VALITDDDADGMLVLKKNRSLEENRSALNLPFKQCTQMLIRELLMATPALSGGSYHDDDGDDMGVDGLKDHARHAGTRVLPVFVISITVRFAVLYSRL
jgi:hypothetical protein